MPAVLGTVLLAIFGFGLFDGSAAGWRVGEIRGAHDSIVADAAPFATAPARAPSAPELIRNASPSHDGAGESDRLDLLAANGFGRNFSESAEITAFPAAPRTRRPENHPIYHATGPPPASHSES